jgi:hypothetical protein
MEHYQENEENDNPIMKTSENDSGYSFSHDNTSHQDRSGENSSISSVWISDNSHSSLIFEDENEDQSNQNQNLDNEQDIECVYDNRKSNRTHNWMIDDDEIVLPASTNDTQNESQNEDQDIECVYDSRENNRTHNWMIDDDEMVLVPASINDIQNENQNEDQDIECVYNSRRRRSHNCKIVISIHASDDSTQDQNQNSSHGSDYFEVDPNNDLNIGKSVTLIDENRKKGKSIIQNIDVDDIPRVFIDFASP